MDNHAFPAVGDDDRNSRVQQDEKDGEVENEKQQQQRLLTIAACSEDDTVTVGKKTGQCKWFSNVHGYGFLTVCVGDNTGTDVFVHHSGIRPANSMYKSLIKGEYVTFDIVEGAQGTQAVNVRGINGGSLLCDHVQSKRINTAANTAVGAPVNNNPVSSNRSNNGSTAAAGRPSNKRGNGANSHGRRTTRTTTSAASRV